MDIVFQPFIDIFEGLIDDILSIFELPEIDFTFPVSARKPSSCVLRVVVSFLLCP